MILNCIDGFLRVDWPFQLMENCRDSDIHEIFINYKIKYLIVIKEFYEKKFKITTKQNKLIYADLEAFNFFQNISKKKWLKLYEISSYLGYNELIFLLTAIGLILNY